MERYNLKSSIEFGYSLKDKTDYEYRQLRDSYDSFLKQPLKLEMFIGEDAIFIFQWEFKEWNDLDMENQKIEDLLNDDLIYVLNDNAIKQIGI